MEVEELKEKLCRGVTPTEGSDFRKVEKVLAPFLQTLKKRKHDKADVMPAVYEELYLKRNPKLLTFLQTAFTDALELRTLMNETAELLKVVTKSKSVNLYLMDHYRGDILLCPKYYQNNKRFEKRYRIESGTYLAAHVAFTKEYIISSDILGDVRFPLGIPDVPVVKSVICLPIITNAEENCIGIIELYRECSEKPYDLINLQICNALTTWMGIAVEQNKARLNLLKDFEIRAQFSDLADLYFSGVIPFNRVVSDFLKLTKTAVNADKGAFYIFHETVSPGSEETLIADAYEEGTDNFEETVLYKKRVNSRFVKNQPGIPGYAARTGEIINIQDAYKDFRFDRKSDTPFYRTRSVVAFPVKNENGVLAVLLLINSLDYPYFRLEDVNLVQSFLNFITLICGYFLLDRAYSKVVNKMNFPLQLEEASTSAIGHRVIDASSDLTTRQIPEGKHQLKLLVTDKLLDYHTKPSAEDLNMVKLFSQGEQQPPASFFNFDWYILFFEEEILKHIIYIFMYSDILEATIEVQNLADFVLRVKKSYRSGFYHNFEHAFYVLHFAFLIIVKNKDVYSVAESVTILLAALCHDIDNSGLSNTFLSLTNDPTYKLYGDCCGEAHRYELVMFFIQQTDLLSNVSAVTFQTIRKNLKKLILGFNMGILFQNRQTITKLLNAGSFDWDNPEHRLISQNMVLFCSDYSVHFKNFEISKKFSSLFYKELYKQGDLEKSMGFSPLPMLDRKKIDTYPQNQVILLSIVLLPVVEILARLFPNLDVLEKLVSFLNFVAGSGFLKGSPCNVNECPNQPNVDIYRHTIDQWNELLQSQGQEMWKMNQAVMKDRRLKHKIKLSSTLSSIRTIGSNEARSLRF